MPNIIIIAAYVLFALMGLFLLQQAILGIKSLINRTKKL